MSIKDFYNKEDFKQKAESDRLFLSMMILMSQTPGFEHIVNNLYGDFDAEYNGMIEDLKNLNTEQIKPMLVDFLTRYKDMFKEIIEDNKEEIKQLNESFKELNN
jgi:hypothetical protein